MAALSLAFDILAKDKASPAFRSVGDSADGLGRKLGNVGKVAKVAIGGAAVAAVAGLGTAMVGGVKAAINYETLQKKTTAVIKSTGNVANISVKGIQNLASKLETLSGVDEELIINGQNVLATFTKIRNETGKGNKIFDQATTAALDLSVALGTDLQAANTMVGKALNDPIAGLTSLTRAGIQFTDQQKNLIRTLVESGDTLGAQKVILGELETQFGGTAKAAGSGLAGDMARLKDAWDDAFRSLATALLPTLTDFAAWLSEKVPIAIDLAKDAFGALKDWWDTNGPKIMDVINAFKTGVEMVFVAVIQAGEFVMEHWDEFKILAEVLAAAIIAQYVRLGVAATASAVTQGRAWVGITAAAIASKAQTAAIVALMIADWIRFAAAAVKNAAIVAASWAKALGPIAAVIAAAEVANNLIGNKEGDPAAGNSFWDNLTRNPFDGMDLGFSNPFGKNARGTSNWRGGMSWVGEEGPELLNLPRGSQVIPNGKSMAMAGAFDAVGEDQLLALREQNGLLSALLAAVTNGGDTTLIRGRAAMAVMG